MRAAEDEDMISWLAVYEALISKIKDTHESETEAEAAPMINYPEDVRGLIASLPSGYAPAMQALKKTQATEKQLVVYQMEIQMAIVGAADAAAGIAAMKQVALKKPDWTKVDPEMEDLKQAILVEYKLKEKQKAQSGGGGVQVPTLAMSTPQGQTVNDPNGCYDCGAPNEMIGHAGCASPGQLLNGATPASFRISQKGFCRFDAAGSCRKGNNCDWKHANGTGGTGGGRSTGGGRGAGGYRGRGRGGNYRGGGGQNSRGSGVRSVAAAAGIKSRSKKGKEKTSQQIADELVQRGRTLAIQEAREGAKKHDRGQSSDEDEDDAPGSAAKMVSAIFGAPKKKKKSTFMMRMQTVHEEDLGECEDELRVPSFGNMTVLSTELMDMSMSGFDTCSGGSVSTDESSFLWLDKRPSAIAGHGVQGVGKGGMNALGFGPKVRAVPMTGSGRLKLMIDPKGMCLHREKGDPHIDVYGGLRMQDLGLPMKMDADGIEGLNVLKDRFTGETVKIEAHGGLLMMEGAKFNVKRFVQKHGIPKLQEICEEISRGERSALVDVADIDRTDKVSTDMRRLTEKSQMSRGYSRKRRGTQKNSEGRTSVQANAQKNSEGHTSVQVNAQKNSEDEEASSTVSITRNIHHRCRRWCKF